MSQLIRCDVLINGTYGESSLTRRMSSLGSTKTANGQAGLEMEKLLLNIVEGTRIPGLS